MPTTPLAAYASGPLTKRFRKALPQVVTQLAVQHVLQRSSLIRKKFVFHYIPA